MEKNLEKESLEKLCPYSIVSVNDNDSSNAWPSILALNGISSEVNSSLK